MNGANMKKTIAIVLTVMFIICATLSLVGCTFNSLFCDPSGKEWHNYVAYPSIYNPCREIYDGSYSIEIDKKGNVEFKLLTGEVLKGVLTTSFNIKNKQRPTIFIEFENGSKAEGWCTQDSEGRKLYFWYNGKVYNFSDKVQCTKEEMDAYRSQFVEFLINVYETGVFPTREEIESNKLYKRFTGYARQDAGHSGNVGYAIAERAKIQYVSIRNDIRSVVVNINGVIVDCIVDYNAPVKCYEIKNGTIQEIEMDNILDIKKGECLILRGGISNGDEITYHITDIFYVE